MDASIIGFEIIYVPQKAVKGQALADFLAAHPIPDNPPLSDNLPDEEVFCTEIHKPWKMFFDGASQRSGARAGVIFLTPENGILPYSFVLVEPCTNNMAEYGALIIGQELALQIGVESLIVHGDSQLVVTQLKGIYEVRKPELIEYFERAKNLIGNFQNLQLYHIPRGKNTQADALANLAATLAQTNRINLPIKIEERRIIPNIQEVLKQLQPKQAISSQYWKSKQ